MPRSALTAGIAVVAAVGCASCAAPPAGSTATSTSSSGGAARSFDMGFTPWPYDATVEAIDWTWSTLRADGDLVSQHIEEGVPWIEAASGAPFPASFEALIADRKKRAAGMKQLLSVNALDLSRTHLAGLRTDQLNAPLPPPWNAYALDDPAVISAYLAYVRRMIDRLEPTYVQTGIEVNLLRRDGDAEAWAAFVRLQCSVYKGLKAAGYAQPISVSLVSTPFYKPELYDKNPNLVAHRAALKDLEPCVDLVAWSVYPFMSGLLANDVPDDYFPSFLGLTSKPQGISESGFPAETWSLPNGPTWESTPEKQRRFADQLLRAAAERHLAFVVWFPLRDYDALWSKPTSAGGLGQDAVSIVWRDSGLYDPAGLKRAAGARWSEAFSVPHE
ncbi:MAG: hypothetical protein U0414_02750 [Polyangiaceae bacterium]